MTKKKPTLLLLPNLLDAGQDPHLFLPPIVRQKLKDLDGLIAESPKEGRRFLKNFTFDRFAAISEIPLAILNEHTKPDELTDLLKPILEGQTWGLISDAGLPCLADPGAQLVWKARERGIEIETFPGPCSITMALQLSGMHGQSFCFHGYVPRKPEELQQNLRNWERFSSGTTHIFIETPYRNEKVLSFLLELLDPSWYVSVVWSLGSPDQGVITRSVQAWKKSTHPDLKDKPAVFLLNKKN